MNEVPIETKYAIAHALDTLKAINAHSSIKLYSGSDIIRVDIDGKQFGTWNIEKGEFVRSFNPCAHGERDNAQNEKEVRE